MVYSIYFATPVGLVNLLYNIVLYFHFESLSSYSFCIDIRTFFYFDFCFLPQRIYELILKLFPIQPLNMVHIW